ncbi:ATP-binding protein [Myroides pelagicus]|uniref:ATP-binding protein n=1 Tax=Myroides pelagicus TaxID=270914 RepID=UPI0036448625
MSLIFRKFYRVIQNNVHNTKGLGIGLYQIKNIIDQQNGSINVKSKINHGTTFTIKLPYE